MYVSLSLFAQSLSLGVWVGGDDGAQLAIGTDKINDISQGCNHSFMCMCVQEKREEYHRQQRQKEEEELRKKKQIQREKVTNLLKLHPQ